MKRGRKYTSPGLVDRQGAVDPATGEMVDRKLNVVDRPNFIKEALRQSAVASQNGFTIRWEVPNEAVQAKAQRILSANGIKNIKVVVVPK